MLGKLDIVQPNPSQTISNSWMLIDIVTAKFIVHD